MFVEYLTRPILLYDNTENVDIRQNFSNKLGLFITYIYFPAWRYEPTSLVFMRFAQNQDKIEG